MVGERKALSSAYNHKVDLPTWYLPPMYIPFAPFSNLAGDESKKATATNVLKYPKTDFRIGKPELQNYIKRALYKDSSIMNRWLFFDQLVIGIETIEPRFKNRFCSMLEIRFFFSTNQPVCFRIESYQ